MEWKQIFLCWCDFWNVSLSSEKIFLNYLNSSLGKKKNTWKVFEMNQVVAYFELSESKTMKMIFTIWWFYQNLFGACTFSLLNIVWNNETPVCNFNNPVFLFCTILETASLSWKHWVCRYLLNMGPGVSLRTAIKMCLYLEIGDFYYFRAS